MAEPSDRQLLEDYAAGDSQVAFAMLVQRHLNLVYSVAIRRLDDPHQAQEVTQAVFIILARKAAGLRREVVLTGWLYQTARLASADFRRGESRRQRREHEAYMQSTLDPSPAEAPWEKLAPLLDDAMARLGHKDRDAILLRYFEGRSLAEVAAALKVNEPAVKKRVGRAVEKLRKFFIKRGTVISASVLAGAIGANSVQAAPASLAPMVVSVAAAKGASAGASVLALIKSTLKLMLWAKVKSGAAVAAAAVLLAGAATMAVQETFSAAQTKQTAEMANTTRPLGEFESFIKHPPSILNAVWEEDLPSMTLQASVAQQVGVAMTNRTIPASTSAFRLVYDGNNYSLVHIADVHSVIGLGGSGGQFNSVQWGAHYGQDGLTSLNCFVVVWDTNSDPVDYSLEQNQTNHFTPSGMANVELMARYEARRFLCLGMFEMVPGTAIWTNGQHQFTATYDEPSAFKPDIELDATGAPFRTNLVLMHGQMTVKLKYDNEVPIEAEVDLDCGIQYVVFYKYSPDFAAGRLPIEFRRYLDRSRREEGKSYTIRVNKLELAPGPIPITDFEYRNALNRKGVPVKVWTNGEFYREAPWGLVKAPTVEEFASDKTTRDGSEATIPAPKVKVRQTHHGIFSMLPISRTLCYTVCVALACIRLAAFLIDRRRQR